MLSNLFSRMNNPSNPHNSSFNTLNRAILRSLRGISVNTLTHEAITTLQTLISFPGIKAANHTLLMRTISLKIPMEKMIPLLVELGWGRSSIEPILPYPVKSFYKDPFEPQAAAILINHSYFKFKI